MEIITNSLIALAAIVAALFWVVLFVYAANGPTRDARDLQLRIVAGVAVLLMASLAIGWFVSA